MSLVVRKPAFCICENKDADQLRGAAKLISAFVFATWIVQSLLHLNPKFQASNHLVWLYSLVCVRPGRKHRRLVFSKEAHMFLWRNKQLICLILPNTHISLTSSEFL